MTNKLNKKKRERHKTSIKRDLNHPSKCNKYDTFVLRQQPCACRDMCCGTLHHAHHVSSMLMVEIRSSTRDGGCMVYSYYFVGFCCRFC